MYGGVDKLDQMLKDWVLRYFTWSWWHALLDHGQAIAYTQVWQIYRECASGLVDPRWKVDNSMTCQKFRQRLAEQQVKYRSADCKYPGDDPFQSYTKLSKKRRDKRLSQFAEASDGDTRVSYEAWYDVKYPRGRSEVSRLCSYDLTFLKTHLHFFLKVTKGNCQVGGTGPVFFEVHVVPRSTTCACENRTAKAWNNFVLLH